MIKNHSSNRPVFTRSQKALAINIGIYIYRYTRKYIYIYIYVTKNPFTPEAYPRSADE